MGVGAAVIGSAVLGAGASAYSASKQADAAKQAGQVSAAQYQQTRADLAPWRTVGGAANYELGALAGLPVNYPTTRAGEVIDTTAREVAPRNALARFGRGGDTQMAHVTPGEIVVPPPVARQPGVRNQLYQGFRDAGMEPGQFVVGTGRNNLNPRTGRREFQYGGSASGRTGFEGSPEHGGRDAYGGNPRDTGADNRGFFGSRNNMLYPGPGPGPGPVAPVGTPLPEDYYSRENALARFYESPEYLLPFEEGGRQIEASAAARGGLFSGATGRALTQYGQDLGRNQFQQYWNNLYGLSGTGANAAAQTGQIGMQSAQLQGNALYNQGNAYANMGTGINNAIVGGIGNYLYYKGLQ